MATKKRWVERELGRDTVKVRVHGVEHTLSAREFEQLAQDLLDVLQSIVAERKRPLQGPG